MTQPGESDTYVVWLAGSEHRWFSCVMAVFDREDAALRYAGRLKDSRSDPGDRIIVQGFVMGDPDAAAIDLLETSP